MVVKNIDTVFKALADPSRRELLEDANLISVQWQGREKLHFFNPVPIHEIYERWIRKFEEERLAALHNFKRKLERSAP